MPPAFWLALLVLVLNDHVLKGSGVVPAVITGKLSDFAGLIVAPLLLCAALSVQSDGGRRTAIGVVALGFAAVKLSPACAEGAGRLLTALGVPSRIWCDPTDLIAFAVLPFALVHARQVQPVSPLVPRRVAIAAASLACVATSTLGPEALELRGPFLINWTLASIEATVSLRSIACEETPGGAPGAWLEQRYVIGPAEMAPLGNVLAMGDAGSPSCGEADVRVGDATVHATWSANVSEVRGQELYDAYSDAEPDGGAWLIDHNDDWAFERGIIVHGPASQPVIELGALLQATGAP